MCSLACAGPVSHAHFKALIDTETADRIISHQEWMPNTWPVRHGPQASSGYCSKGNGRDDNGSAWLRLPHWAEFRRHHSRAEKRTTKTMKQKWGQDLLLVVRFISFGLDRDQLVFLHGFWKIHNVYSHSLEQSAVWSNIKLRSTLPPSR